MRYLARLLLGLGVLVAGTAIADAQGSKEVDALIKQFKGGSTPDRIKAAEGFAKLGEEAKPAAKLLCEAAVSGQPKLAAACLEALEKVWPALYTPVVAAITEKDPRKRAEACRTIGLLGDDGAIAVPVLIESLKRCVANDDEYWYEVNPAVSAAVETIKQLAPTNADFTKLMLLAAGPVNKHYYNRGYVLETLGDLAETNAKIQKQVRQSATAALADSQSQVRVAGVRTLGKLGPAAKDSLSLLKKLKFDPDEKVRQAAGEAIERIQKK
jgi:HEAT repeat protein